MQKHFGEILTLSLRPVIDIGATAIGGLDREMVRRLSQRSDARGLMQLAMHVGLLSATTFLLWASRGHLWLAPALVLQGIVLSFLFCALHESIHRSAFASRWLNDLVAWSCGAMLLLPPGYFRCFHFAHHRFTQDPARDPELTHPAPTTLTSYLWRVSGWPYWKERVTVTLRHAFLGRVREPFVPPEQSAAIVAEARALWGFYLLVMAASLYLRRAELLWYWVLPALAGQPFLRLFLLAEHTSCAFVDDMRLNTRTTQSNFAVRLLVWRMSYHTEHHCFPSVPFHALARLHALIGQSAQVTAPGYLAVQRQLLRQLPLRRALSSQRRSFPAR